MADVTQKKEALHEQRDWLRVTLASIGDAVITTDTDSCVTFLNSVAESLTGWTLAEAIGQPLINVFKIINQETRHTVESPTERALRDGVIVGLANHTLLIAKDGTEKPIDDSAAPIRNVRNEVAGVVLVFRDITERYRQEQTIQDTLNYANNIIATLREPFVVINGELKVHTANRAFYEIFCTTQSETEGRFIYELGHGQWNIPRLRKMLGEVLVDHLPVMNYEVEQDFPVIGRRFMVLNAVRIRKPGDDSNLILLAIEDVTDKRKRIEARLKDSELRFLRLFESAKDGILILNFYTGQVTDANPSICDLLGGSRSDLIGKELWQFGLLPDKSANDEALQKLQRVGVLHFEHLPLKTILGRELEIEVVANAYTEEHKPVIQCHIRDITERSRLERQTREQAVELADLHRRKDEFLAMLSHELRNPLAPIAGAVKLLGLQKEENRLQQTARTIIERQVGQLTRLVDELMEVSRITTGRIHLQPEQISLNAIVEQAVESVRPLIEQRRQVLHLTLPTQPIWLYADGSRLEQVIVNLLNNAAKYTQEAGQIALTVDQQGEEAVLRVRDSGVGIAPEFLPRIFDLFTQSERSLDRAEGGLGIGLCLVQKLVELHHGRVEAYSALGQGSEFVVRLPVVIPASIQLFTSNPQVERAGPGLKVLVADDNDDIVQILSILLTQNEHQIRTASDGKTALEVAIDFQPHAVVLDIGLPGLSGYEVAKRLRQESTLANVVLIALTGYGQDADKQLSFEAGIDHHLVKPGGIAQVQGILSNIQSR